MAAGGNHQRRRGVIQAVQATGQDLPANVVDGPGIDHRRAARIQHAAAVVEPAACMHGDPGLALQHAVLVVQCTLAGHVQQLTCHQVAAGVVQAPGADACVAAAADQAAAAVVQRATDRHRQSGATVVQQLATAVVQ